MVNLAHVCKILWVAVVLVSGFCLDSHGNDNGYTIQLKNGFVVETSAYVEDGDMIYYQRFGTRIGVKKQSVVSIAPKEAKRVDSNIRAVEYMGHLVTPRYYHVSGLAKKRKWRFKGLYEEVGTHNNHPKFKQLNGDQHLFYNNTSKNSGAWVLGKIQHHGKSISYANIHAPEAMTPDAPGVWTTSTGVVMHPDIRVTEAEPPASIHDGRFTYGASGFPVDDFNGFYKPNRIYNGRIRYRHVKFAYELYYDRRWIISYCPKNCFSNYKSQAVNANVRAHEITRWYDANGRHTNGVIRPHQQ